MKKLCTQVGCKVIVDTTGNETPRCDNHKREYRTKPQEERQRKYTHHYNEKGQNVYGTYRWKKLRKAKVTIDPLCEHCMLNNIAKAVEEVDHIIELEDGGEMWDIDNLQSLCKRHHIIKTNLTKRQRKHKKDGYGYYLSPKK